MADPLPDVLHFTVLRGINIDFRPIAAGADLHLKADETRIIRNLLAAGKIKVADTATERAVRILLRDG